jgi:FkbM family methyltransferase
MTGREIKDFLTQNCQKTQDLYPILDRVLGSDLIQIDGGAKGGTRDLPRLAPYTVSYGFEPNPSEYEKIIQGKIPAGTPAYKKTNYSPYALMEKTGEALLFISKRPAASSTLRPDAALLSHFAQDNWSQLSEIVGTEKVPGISLPDFAQQSNLAYIDYVKLDTQGNELSILRACGPLLSKIGVIRTEVELLPIYENQPLLGDMCNFLLAQGFQLIDLIWSDPCRRYHFSPNLPPESYRLVWAEAVFAYQPLTFAGERKLEQALILAEMGYLDLALYMISQLPNLLQAEKDALLRFYQLPAPFTWKYLVKQIIRTYLLRQRPVPKAVARVP